MSPLRQPSSLPVVLRRMRGAKGRRPPVGPVYTGSRTYFRCYGGRTPCARGFLVGPTLCAQQVRLSHLDQMAFESLRDDDDDDGAAVCQSFEREAALQDMEKELFHLLKQNTRTAAPETTAARPRESTAAVKGDRPSAAKESRSSLSGPVRKGDVEEAVGEPPKQPTLIPLVLTAERQRWPAPSPPAPAVPPSLTRTRWPGVSHQRYRGAVPVTDYVRRAHQLVAECEAFLHTPRHRSAALWCSLAELHSDALLCMIECLVVRDPVKGTTESTQLLLALWDLLSSPASGRALELSSKQVVWAAELFQQTALSLALCSPPVALSRSLLYGIVYVNRKSLRRGQSAGCLQVLLRLPPADSAAAKGERELYSACLNHCVVRCLEKSEASEVNGLLDGCYHTAHLLQETLTVASAFLDFTVQQAALRGVLNRLRQRVAATGKRRPGLLPAYLDGILVSTSKSATRVFRQMDSVMAETDAFAIHSLDQRWLAARSSSSPPSSTSFPAPSVAPAAKADSALLNDLQFLSSRLPPHDAELSGRYLRTAGSVHAVVSSLVDWSAALSLSSPVEQCFPPLATALLVKILSLSPQALRGKGKEEGEEGGGEGEGGEVARRLLAAVYQLFPHADAVDVAEAFVKLTPLIERVAPVASPFVAAVIRCVAHHVPTPLVPVVLARMLRARELATCPLSPLAVKFVKTLVHALPAGSLSHDDARVCALFVEAEELRHRLPTASTPPPLVVDLSLNGLMLSCEARKQKQRVTTALTETNGGPQAAPPTQRTALHELFGYSAAIERSVCVPEVLHDCQTALAWLYQVYSMSLCLAYELKVLSQLASAQGVRLRLSPQRERLVSCSELSARREQGYETEAQRTPIGLVHLLPVLPAAGGAGAGAGAHNDQRVGVATAAYTEQLTQEASWRCLSFFLNAALLGRRREKPDHRCSALHAQEQLRRQLSLGDAVEPLIECFFAFDSGGSDGVPRVSASSTVRGKVLPLLASYEQFLLRQPTSFPYEVAALLRWTRCATCLCLIQLLSEGGAEEAEEAEEARLGVAWKELVAMYRSVLCMATEAMGRRVAMRRTEQTLCFPSSPPVLPAVVHEKVFSAMCNDPDLWKEALALLELVDCSADRRGAAAGSTEEREGVRLPSSVYRAVMEACLMHRAAVPGFVRDRVLEGR